MWDGRSGRYHCQAWTLSTRRLTNRAVPQRLHLLAPLLLCPGLKGSWAGMRMLCDGSPHMRRRQPLARCRPAGQPGAGGVDDQRPLSNIKEE